MPSHNRIMGIIRGLSSSIRDVSRKSIPYLADLYANMSHVANRIGIPEDYTESFLKKTLYKLYDSAVENDVKNDIEKKIISKIPSVPDFGSDRVARIAKMYGTDLTGVQLDINPEEYGKRINKTLNKPEDKKYAEIMKANYEKKYLEKNRKIKIKKKEKKRIDKIKGGS